MRRHISTAATVPLELSMAAAAVGCIGPVQHGDGIVAVDIALGPADLDGLPGEFEGRLELRGEGGSSTLTMVGDYVPGHRLQQYGDGLVDHHMARQALGRFVREAADRLLAAARTGTQVSPAPTRNEG